MQNFNHFRANCIPLRSRGDSEMTDPVFYCNVYAAWWFFGRLKRARGIWNTVRWLRSCAVLLQRPQPCFERKNRACGPWRSERLRLWSLAWQCVSTSHRATRERRAAILDKWMSSYWKQVKTKFLFPQNEKAAQFCHRNHGILAKPRWPLVYQVFKQCAINSYAVLTPLYHIRGRSPQSAFRNLTRYLHDLQGLWCCRLCVIHTSVDVSR